MGTERGFGVVFGVVGLIIACWPLMSGGSVRLWALALAMVFFVLAFARPSVLAPLNRLWFRFGLLLGAIIAPIVMALIFFLTVTPTGLILRLFGKDPLNQKSDKAAKSYWIERKEPVGSMKNQF